MKISEINSQIKKHIAPQLSGYKIHRDIVYKQEENFFLKYYCVVSTGNDEDDIYVSAAIQPLYVRSDFLYKTFGFNLSHKKRTSLFGSRRSELWDARKEHLDNSFQSINQSILHQGEPFMNSVNSAKQFYQRFAGNIKDNISYREGVAYSTIIFGSDKQQRDCLKNLIDFCDSQIATDEDEVEIKIRKDATVLLNAESTERLKILKAWANETIECLKLPNIQPLK